MPQLLDLSREEWGVRRGTRAVSPENWLNTYPNVISIDMTTV